MGCMVNRYNEFGKTIDSIQSTMRGSLVALPIGTTGSILTDCVALPHPNNHYHQQTLHYPIIPDDSHLQINVANSYYYSKTFKYHVKNNV